MGFRFEYICGGCGNVYVGDVGGGRYFELFRCYKCDKVKIIQKAPMMALPGKCECSGNFAVSIDPKCPKCRGRGDRKRLICAYD